MCNLLLNTQKIDPAMAINQDGQRILIGSPGLLVLPNLIQSSRLWANSILFFALHIPKMHSKEESMKSALGWIRGHFSSHFGHHFAKYFLDTPTA